MDSPSRQFSLLSSTGEGEEGGSSGRTLHFNLAMEELEDDFFDGAKKWRLNRDQVKFLETSFAMENKLESTRKSLIASKLGIHPRKVAVWFQNRRARRKTKQLESDFHALKRHYDSALKEKENLKSQISRLVALLDDQTHRMLPATLEPIIGPGNNAKNDETSSSIAPSPPSNLTSTNERGYDLSTMDDTTHGVVVGCTMDGVVMGHVDTLLIPSDSYGYNYEYDYEGLQLGADMYNINHNKKKEGGSIVVEGDPYNNPIPMAWDDCSLFLWFD